MRNKAKLNDERLAQESNTIYKYSFHFLCLFLLFDIIYKFYCNNTFASFSNGKWINYVPELVILVLMLYAVLFVHAYRGVLVYALDLPNDKFQLKRALWVSTIVSGGIAVFAFVIPVIVKELVYGIPEMPFAQIFMLYLLIALGFFFVLFMLINVNFYLAFLLARYKNITKNCYDDLS